MLAVIKAKGDPVKYESVRLFFFWLGIAFFNTNDFVVSAVYKHTFELTNMMNMGIRCRL